MFFGRIPGALGEGFKFAILIGLLYLLIRRAADFRVVVSYFGAYVAFMALAGLIVVMKIPSINFGQFMLFQLLTGGVLFAGVYMFTDPVTMPINSPGRVMYGILGGGLTVAIRLFGALPEGATFSILICNLVAPAFDHYSFSSQKFTKKKIVFTCGMVAVFALAIGLGLGLQGVVS